MSAAPPDNIRNRLLVARLPAMPQILLKLIELCQSDEAGMAELAQLISNDAGMTARVLRVANSAAYQRSQARVGLMPALATLGADTVKTLLISESVFQTFNSFAHTGSTDLRSFWHHALNTAVLARGLAKAMRYPQLEEAYLAGLLHDVGRLALLAAAPDMYGAHFQAPDDDQLCALELSTLDITHAEAGAWLIEHWEMDSFLADSTLYHHEPPARVMTAHPLIRLLHLANALGQQPPDAPLPLDMGAICGVSDADLRQLQQDAQAQVKQAADNLGIDLSGVSSLSAPPASAPPPPNPMQQRLTEEMRNRALTSEIGQVFARQKGDAQLHDSIRQSARLLFELDDTALFLLSSNGRALVAASVGERRQRLADLSISLAGGGIADVVAQKELTFLQSGQRGLTLADEQLLRAFAGPRLLCVPLVSGNRAVGLLMAGVPDWRVAELQRQDKFLLAFGAQAAAALALASQARSELDRHLAAQQEEHLKNSRKIVHEASNPLSIIKNYLGVLDDKLARQESVSGELSILNEEIDRVGSIIKEFARVTPPAPDTLMDVNKVLADIVRLFRDSRFLPATVQISAQLPDEPAEITAASGTVKQIFVNLIKNAVEAMPKGGRIEVINAGRTQRGGFDFVLLQVKDNGPGLPAEVQAKLFSPVRSSKAGDNRGLGLSIVHDLVHKLHGQISCKSSPMGTCFDILLPMRRQKAVAP